MQSIICWKFCNASLKYQFIFRTNFSHSNKVNFYIYFYISHKQYTRIHYSDEKLNNAIWIIWIKVTLQQVKLSVSIQLFIYSDYIY